MRSEKNRDWYGLKKILCEIM